MNSYSHILFPSDFSHASELAAARAKAVADCTGARLSVLHVVDYVLPRYVAAEVPDSYGSEKAVLERARAHFKAWMDENGLGDCKLLLKTGSPKSTIVQTAHEIGADLIVMGTHGERGINRLLGSTTMAVMHDAGCDTLAVRASHASPPR